MDAQELRNLQEAYLEVVSNDLNEMSYKKLPVGKMMWKVSDRAEREADTRAERERQADDPHSTLAYDRARAEHEKAERNKERSNKMIRVADTHSKKAAKAKSKLKKEQVDLYDIILSHLLDEGYAETVEAAEAIMVNMSEDWRESICEELTGERKKRALEKGTPLANRVARAKEGQPRERTGPPYLGATKKAPIKRGGIGDKGRGKSEWTGYESDRGSGNKAARRAGKKVRDTSDEL